MGDDQFRVEMREDISQKIFAALKISNQATEQQMAGALQLTF